MNQKTFLALLACALPFAAACGDTTAEPIGSGGGSSASTSGSSSASSPASTGTTTTSGGGGASGACAPACGSGEVCVESSCHAVTKLDTAGSTNEGACNIVLDATHVYWKTGDVRRVAKAGGPSTLLDFTTTSPGGLAVDDTYLYWTSLGILRAEKTAASVPGTTAGIQFADEGGSPTHLAGDGTTLFYLDGSTIDEVPTAGTPAPDAPPTVFDGTWSGVGGPVAVDATSVYSWSEAASLLVKENKSTHASITLGNRGNGKVDDNCGIVVDGDTVYYSTAPLPAEGGIVASVSVAGGQQPTIVVDTSAGATGVFAVDGTSVYFMTPTGVLKVAKSGGTPVSLSNLSPPSAFPTCIAVDDTYVYWVDGLDLMQYKK